MALSNRDRRKAIQESAHHLEARLRRCVGSATRNNDGPVTCTIREARRTEPLRQPAYQPNRSSRPERGPVVLIHFVAEPSVADLVETHELIQTLRASIGHEKTMECDGQTRFA